MMGLAKVLRLRNLLKANPTRTAMRLVSTTIECCRARGADVDTGKQQVFR